MKVSPGVSVFRHAKCSLAPKMMLVVTLQSVLQVSFRPAGDSELTEEHGEHDGHEGELDARVPQLYSRTHRRCREWENVVWDGSSLSRVEVRTHCAGLPTSRWKNTGICRTP